MKLRLLCAQVITLLILATVARAQASPDPADDLLRKARESASAGKFEEALKAYKDANKRSNGNCSPCYLGMAMMAAKLGDAKTALESADKALKVATDDPNRALAHNMRGHALIALAAEQPKKLSEAESAFRQAVQLQPANASYHVNLGVALAKLMRDEDAVAEFKRAVELAPQGEAADIAQSFAQNPRRAREPVAPNFQIESLNGGKIALHDFAGKVVVLDFWATWCAPCRASVPDIKDLIKKYGTERLAVISISWDQDEKAWRDYIAKHEMGWTHGRDPDSDLSHKLGVRAVPTYLVIDGDGFIKERIVGTNAQQSLAYRLREKLQSMPQLAKK